MGEPVNCYVLVQISADGQAIHYLEPLSPRSWSLAVPQKKKECLSKGVGGRMARPGVDNVFHHTSPRPKKPVNTLMDIELCNILKKGIKGNFSHGENTEQI